MSHQAVVKFNFFRGHPSTDLLPTKQILQASTKILQRFDQTNDNYDGFNDTHPLNYGPDLGNLEVRTLIAKWNDKNFKLRTPTKPECINLTSGASYGIMNVLSQVTSPWNGLTRRCFMVTPTYFLINAAIIDAGFGKKMTGITELADGQFDFEALEKELKYYDSLEPVKAEIIADDISSIYDPDRPLKKIYRYVMYVVPTFSNPKGGSLTYENRVRLIKIARKYDMLLICDDVYDLLDYREGNPDHYKRLVHIDRETLPEGEEFGNVVSNATFSKILGPGLRVGFQETATSKLAHYLSQGGAHRSGGTPAHLNTVIVGEILKNGAIDEIIANLNKVYSERAHVLTSALEKYMPKGTDPGPFQGGYFRWITLPEGYDSSKIAKICRERGVILATGDNFEVTGDDRHWGDSGVRLSISHLTPDLIEEGIKIWGEVCAANKP